MASKDLGTHNVASEKPRTRASASGKPAKINQNKSHEDLHSEAISTQTGTPLVDVIQPTNGLEKFTKITLVDLEDSFGIGQAREYLAGKK
eukprot:937142-Amorphochlora_amoeboformis.AAC.1